MALSKMNDKENVSKMRFLQSNLLEDSLANLVKNVWFSYSRCLQIKLMEHSVSFGHWIFLRILWEKEGLTQKAISLMADLSEPTTHSALKMMGKLGYIERRKALDNKKNIYIYLTDHGRKLKDELLPLALDVNMSSLDELTESDIDITRRTLSKISENLVNFEKKYADIDRKLPSTRELTQRVKSQKEKK